MAAEFKTVLDHGTYILNALVKADSKTVQLYLVGEREGEELRIVENDDVPFHSFELAKTTDSVDEFRKQYMAYLEKGGKEELERILNPISVFNVEAVAEPKVVAPKKAPTKKKAPAKPKPKAK